MKIKRINESIKFERKKKEDKQRELNELEVQMNDLINKNQIEIKTYKEQVKEMLCNHQGSINNDLYNTVLALRIKERENRVEQLEVKKDVDILNKKIREKETMMEQHLIANQKSNFSIWRDKRLDVERDLNELKII